MIDIVSGVLEGNRSPKAIRRFYGVYSMEVVLDDWQQDLIAEGEVKGVIETARELGASDEFIITRLMSKQHMSRAGAETALKRYDEKTA